MVPASGQHSLQLATIDPLLDRGIADSEYLRCIAWCIELHRVAPKLARKLLSCLAPHLLSRTACLPRVCSSSRELSRAKLRSLAAKYDNGSGRAWPDTFDDNPLR